MLDRKSFIFGRRQGETAIVQEGRGRLSPTGAIGPWRTWRKHSDGKQAHASRKAGCVVQVQDRRFRRHRRLRRRAHLRERDRASSRLRPKTRCCGRSTASSCRTLRWCCRRIRLVLDTGDKLVLFDTGFGPVPMFGKDSGQLQKNMAAAGIRPEDIDVVISDPRASRSLRGVSPTLRVTRSIRTPSCSYRSATSISGRTRASSPTKTRAPSSKARARTSFPTGSGCISSKRTARFCPASLRFGRRAIPLAIRRSSSSRVARPSSTSATFVTTTRCCFPIRVGNTSTTPTPSRRSSRA